MPGTLPSPFCELFHLILPSILRIPLWQMRSLTSRINNLPKVPPRHQKQSQLCQSNWHSDPAFNHGVALPTRVQESCGEGTLSPSVLTAGAPLIPTSPYISWSVTSSSPLPLSFSAPSPGTLLLSSSPEEWMINLTFAICWVISLKSDSTWETPPGGPRLPPVSHERDISWPRRQQTLACWPDPVLVNKISGEHSCAPLCIY